MLSEVRGLLVHVQSGDTLVVLDVTSHKGQIVLDCGCGNEDIKITNNLARAPQFPSDASKALHDCLGRRKDND